MPQPGTLVGGRYRIVRTLGQGGMGVVYEALHLRLDRPVAIKVLLPELASQTEFRIRFEREGRAAALLKSTHAVRVFDVDTAPEGYTYIVMELLEGHDLGKEASARHPLPAGELVTWVVQACEALDEAHDAGVIHRDIKPANIFLANEGGRLVAKVLDFGISKFEEHVTRAITRPTDGALGTPHYMSPELLRGKRIDRRADIWALGVLLYRILADRWPFTADNDGAYVAAIVTDPVIPLETIRPDLPTGLTGAIMRALEKVPTDRYATAAELAEALAPFASLGDAPPRTERQPNAPPQPAPDTTERMIDPPHTVAMAGAPKRSVAPWPSPAAPPTPIHAPSPARTRALGLIAAVVAVATAGGLALAYRLTHAHATTTPTPAITSAAPPSISSTISPIATDPPASAASVARPPSPSSGAPHGPTAPTSHKAASKASHEPSHEPPRPPASATSLPPDFVPDHL
jgi:serine/threonine-protein kinase